MKKAAVAPTANHPQISASPWQGDREQCPRWVGYPTLESLPAGLIWSGAEELPAIGGRVTIYMNGYGPATVNGYFHADGYLGVICTPDTLPDWFKQQSPGVTKGHFYGIDLVSCRQAAAQAPSPAQARRFGPQCGRSRYPLRAAEPRAAAGIVGPRTPGKVPETRIFTHADDMGAL